MIELWYRLNLFAEKQFLDKRLGLSQGLIVPANIVAYYQIAMPELLSDFGLPFLVDPAIPDCLTRPVVSDNDQKQSLIRLEEKLGCELCGPKLRDTLKIGSTTFDDFITKVVQLQLVGENKEEQPRNKSMARIKRTLGKSVEIKQSLVRPHAIIPPYFYFNNTVGEAYNKSVYAANFAKDHGSSSTNIYPCICMDRQLLLDKEGLSKIANDFKQFKGIIMWIDDFDETEASLQELASFNEFVKIIRSSKNEIINLFGGYFSLLLNYSGLTHLSCGICYSRSRKVSSVAGGGGMPIRYYEPHLKIKLPVGEVFKLYSDNPQLFTCDCPICSEYAEKASQNKDKESLEPILKNFLIGDEATGTRGLIDWQNSRYHFLYTQKKEQTVLARQSKDISISNVEETYNQLKMQIQPIRYGIRQLEYLKRWSDSLR